MLSHEVVQAIEKIGMIQHLVIFKFKAGVPEQKQSELIKELEALFESIKEIQSFESGPNISHEGLDQGFTYIFFMSFKDEADRDTYVVHPLHKKFVEDNLGYAESVLVLDYDNKRSFSR